MADVNPDAPVLCERSGAVAVVTVNRPARRNALSSEVRSALLEQLAELNADASVRAVVITGAGDRAFISGADIAEFAARTQEEQGRAMDGPRVYDAVAQLAKPTVAAINGACLGGGLEVAMACDIRVAAEGARFGQPEVKLGIIPGGGGTQRLPRIVGEGNALRLILTGDLIDAAEAHRLGLVTEVVSPDQLLAIAVAIAERIATNAPLAVAAARDAVRRALDLPLGDGLAMERAHFLGVFASDDRREGMRAFLEKRPARFEGR
jgi:enoyl-CoA hydratase